MQQTIIECAGKTGSIKTVGIVIVETSGDFCWINPGTRFDDDLLSEMTRRGFALDLISMHEPVDDERLTAAFLPFNG